MRLIFVRHGEPDYQHDCLTENGRLQAAATAERLKDESISAIYSSSKGRAVETARYTAEALGLPVTELDFMREIRWGAADPAMEAAKYGGHPWRLAYELATEHPECVRDGSWADHPYFRDNVCMTYFDLIPQKIDELLTQYGLVRKNGIYEAERPCNDTIALFAHGGSGAIMFSHILNLPFPFVLTSLTYGVCSVSALRFVPEDGKTVIPRLVLFNDLRHISKLKSEPLWPDR